VGGAACRTCGLGPGGCAFAADDEVAFEAAVGFVDGHGLDRDHQGDSGGDDDIGQDQVDQRIGPALLQGAGRVIAVQPVSQVIDRRPARRGVRGRQRRRPPRQAGHMGGKGMHEPVEAILSGFDPQRVGIDPAQDPADSPPDSPGRQHVG
jgi:hypothetical protein